MFGLPVWSASETFVLHPWVKHDAVPIGDSRFHRIKAATTAEGITAELQSCRFKGNQIHEMSPPQKASLCLKNG